MPIDRAILFRLATSTRFERATRALPAGERLAWRAASRYVSGTTAADALELAQRLLDRGVGASIDQFGELVDDFAVAEHVAADYLPLAGGLSDVPEDAWLSIDLSHLGLDIDPLGCANRLAAIAGRLPAGRRVQVGAEDHDRADGVVECVLTVAGQGLADRLGATVQANFRRTPADLERLVAAGVHIRLVKGAYLESADRALPYGEATGSGLNYDRALGESAEMSAAVDAVFGPASTTLPAQGRGFRPCPQRVNGLQPGQVPRRAAPGPEAMLITSSRACDHISDVNFELW